MSPMPATPSAMEVNTIGTTVMNSMRRKICPAGNMMLSETKASHDWPAKKALHKPPVTAPSTRPSAILV